MANNPKPTGRKTTQPDKDKLRNDDHDKAFVSNQKEMLKTGQTKPPTPAGKARGQKG